MCSHLLFGLVSTVMLLILSNQLNILIAKRMPTRTVLLFAFVLVQVRWTSIESINLVCLKLR